MKIGVATSVGLVRDHNEDAYWVSDPIFVVCDGMGGHNAGEVASSIAVNVIENFCFSQQVSLSQIQQAISEAHEKIAQKAKDNSLVGMGTTITLGIVEQKAMESWLHLGHVGDSRAYVLRQGHLVQLTHDHSVVAELVRNGNITEGEAVNHPHRHVLTQALGVGEITSETQSYQLEPGDYILLCTDGLSNVVADFEMAKVMQSNIPQLAAETLIDLANKQGGPDNITVIIIGIP